MTVTASYSLDRPIPERTLESKTTSNHSITPVCMICFGKSHFNRISTLELYAEHINGHELGVVRIENRPDKPFYLTRDKTHQGRTVRAGVIYARLGDTNIPLDASASEEMIELLWRERFGIGLNPLSRFQRLLDEPAEWIEIP